MNKGMKKAIAAGLVAAMALTSLAGCAKEDKFDGAAAAITVDGEAIPAGLVKFMVHYTQAASEGFYSTYYGTGAFNMALDQNGTTLGSLVRDGSVTEAKQLVLAEQHAEEYGVSLTDEEKAAAAEAATAFMEANEEEVLKKMGATREIVTRYLELYTLQDKMEVEMSADVDTEVSDEEAAQRRIEYVYFTAAAETEAETEEGAAEEETAAGTEEETAVVTEAETVVETEKETVAETEAETAALTEEEAAKTQSAEETETEAAETEEIETETEDPEQAAAMAKALAKAEAVIEKVKAGEEFEAAVTAVDDSKSVLEMTFGSDDETVIDGLITATEGLTDGTLVETPVATDYGYYVAKVVSALDREATDARKEEIVTERKNERISELYTEWEEAVEVIQDDDVISQIVFDFSLAQETEAATEADSEAAATEAGSEAGTEASETEA